jgi:hypothetical protein
MSKFLQMFRCLEAAVKPVLSCCQGTDLTVPNNRRQGQRLQPLRAGDAPQGLKPPSLRVSNGTTKVVP